MSAYVWFSRLLEAIDKLGQERWCALFDIRDLRRLICDLAFEGTFLPLSVPSGTLAKDAIVAQEFRGPLFIQSAFNVEKYVALHLLITVQRPARADHPENHMWWMPRFQDGCKHTFYVDNVSIFNAGTSYRLKLFIHPEHAPSHIKLFSFSQSLAMLDADQKEVARVTTFVPSTTFLRSDQPLVAEIPRGCTLKLLSVSHRDWTPSDNYVESLN